MSRVPIDDRPAISQWLIRARLTRGGDYTVERFLADLATETGSAPNRATYARWESGAVTPKDASLVPVVAFWSARGVVGPESTQRTAMSLEERAVAAAERQATATEALVAATREQNEMLRGLLLQAMVPDQTTADRMRAPLLEWLSSTPTPSPRPTLDHHDAPAR